MNNFERIKKDCQNIINMNLSDFAYVLAHNDSDCCNMCYVFNTDCNHKREDKQCCYGGHYLWLSQEAIIPEKKEDEFPVLLPRRRIKLKPRKKIIKDAVFPSNTNECDKGETKA